MTFILSRPAAILTFAVAIAGPAVLSAADAGAEAHWRLACTADAVALCPAPTFAGDRRGVQDCLTQRLARLSEACRAVVNAATAPAGQPPTGQPRSPPRV